MFFFLLCPHFLLKDLRVYFSCRVVNIQNPKQPDVVSTKKSANFCNICNITIEGNKKKFGQHNLRHEPKTFICSICGAAFPKNWIIKKHKERKHTERPTCHNCSKTFCTKEALTVHIKNKHLGIDNKKHNCTLCEKLFPDVFKLREHTSRVHEGVVYKCAQCPKTYVTKLSYNNHLKTHASNYNGFKCNQCETTCASERLLRRHIRRIHDGASKCICEVCGKVFLTGANLRDHRHVHTGVKPFSCQECGGKFTKKIHLDLHMRRHTNERPHKCNICEKSFAKGNSLALHVRRMHTKVRPHKCHICERCFLTKTLMKDHIKRAHGTALADIKIDTKKEWSSFKL